MAIHSAAIAPRPIEIEEMMTRASGSWYEDVWCASMIPMISLAERSILSLSADPSGAGSCGMLAVVAVADND